MDKTSTKTPAAQTGIRTPAAPPAPPSLSVPPTTENKRPRPNLFVQILTPFASLRVTVVLFVLSLILVMAGTLAQVDQGIQTVIPKYFRSFFVWVPFQVFFPRSLSIPGGFPFFGGWAIGFAMLVNLLAAHAIRFKMTWKRSGIHILHAGIVVMMIGELVTGLFAVEARMTILEGGASSFVESTEANELVFMTTSKTNPKMNTVIAIPGSKLRKGGTIKDPRLPVDIVVEKYMRNSDIPDTPPADVKNLATEGEGLKYVAVEKGEATGVDANQGVDVPSAYVTFKDKETGESRGTYLVSVFLSAFGEEPQKITINDTPYEVEMRFKRIYKPYTISLKKFSHDLYDGTDIPKNYSSLVQLEDSRYGENREVLIWMNHPMRYDGDTFYQADFLKGRQKGTVLQVVRNPAWTMPYISCTMVCIGMMVHFGFALVGFIRTRILTTATKLPPAKPTNGRRNIQVQKDPLDWTAIGVSTFVVVVAGLYLLVVSTPPAEPPAQINFAAAGKIPVVDGGRTKPLDSVARNKLMIISGKQTIVDESKREVSAMEWFLDVMTSRVSKNGKAESYKVFRIENDQVLSLLGLPEKPGSYRYSITEIIEREKMDVLQEEAERARQKNPKERTLFDVKVLELANHLQLYIEVSRMQTPLVIDPQTPGQQPEAFGPALAAMSAAGEDAPPNQQVMQFATILEGYIKNDVQKFNSSVDKYRSAQAAKHPDRATKAEFETFFNHFAPFYHCMILYVIIFLLAAFSWLFFHKPLNRAAFWLALATLLIHTWALGARMYIQERPPITNLYSTAIFIGWMAVILLLICEWFFKYGIATFLIGKIGFSTLLIAHYLSLDGDTMEMLQAVLDTNFWLATHVTTINIGYAATFVAGGLGLLYIVASIYNNIARNLDRTLFTDVANYMMYGVICFAMLFSFTGTVLGGIWADQSWGRFWGWDPKENGALLIVIWNALILHARWAGMVKARGMAVLAVFGNIITAWSWFGVNMLGVGLHSYGFMQGAVAVLILFALTQVGFMILGMIAPLHQWQWATSGGDNKFKAG